jgi:hypothetical protein
MLCWTVARIELKRDALLLAGDSRERAETAKTKLVDMLWMACSASRRRGSR